jgi:hypothetical protein
MSRLVRHLPLHLWPAADRAAFKKAFLTGDIFDDTAGPGAHLTESTRICIEMVYRRWLGFLAAHHPDDLRLKPAERITTQRVGQFITDLKPTNRATSIHTTIDRLYQAARLIDPQNNWFWFKGIVRKLAARAKPMDRFDKLVPPWQTLDLGIELMDGAGSLARTDHRARELQYRDGLIIALLSLWPIRRRSLAALTIDRHVMTDTDGITLLLHPEDTKSNREESFRVPDILTGYMQHYLDEIRPQLLRQDHHTALWVSYQGGPIAGGQIYTMVRRRCNARFDKAMCLHDFRRAAATFLATEAPDKIGLIPGVLQHLSPDVADQHYNLSRSAEASRRHGATIARMRKHLPRGAR